MTPLMISDAEALFTTQMAAQSSGTPLKFSNTPIPDTQGVYAELFVIPGETFPINLGITAKSRNVGMIQVSVVGPKDQGAGATGAVAQIAGRIFRRKTRAVGTEGQVVYKDPSYMDMGIVNGKHMYVAKIPYRYDFTG